MSVSKLSVPAADSGAVTTTRIFKRFTLGQRWEHGLLFLSITTLLLTGLPQKYFSSWGHLILTTPAIVTLVRQIHHAAAYVLIAEVIYHLGFGLLLLVRRQLSAAIFPTWQDIIDALRMLKYLFFMTDRKPDFGKYNFEQKFTYWFLFFGIGIMVISGFILLFPVQISRLLPGGIIPAAKLAHSTEAITIGIFVIIWHFYHVHIERLNLSIFTGWLNEQDMCAYHARAYRRSSDNPTVSTNPSSQSDQSDQPTGDPADGAGRQ